MSKEDFYILDCCCHIAAPCAYCVNKSIEEEEEASLTENESPDDKV